MNKIFLTGRLGKNPEKFTFSNGGVKNNFSLAVTENYKDKNGEWQSKVTWFNIVLFKETRLKKGDFVLIEGGLSNRSWEDNDGKKHYITEINAERIELLVRPEKTQQERAPADKINQKQEEQEGSDNTDGFPF